MNKLSAMLRKLSEAGVDFVLVGGYAAVTHGASVMTEDVDVCCKFSRDNLERLAGAVADLHPKHRLTPQKLAFSLTDQLAKDLKNLYLETDLCVIDCSEVAGIGNYEEVLKQSVEIETSIGKFRVLSIDALIHAKEVMNRPHDRITAAQLKAIKERRGA
ncbi:MAG TPA: nucleotidyltransferase [Verrucomicrobiae bacterium]|nr:nucleotidyltransferase [Verrucomicrobiae bacterium]